MVSLGLLLLRLVVGGLFALHGAPKLFGGQGTSEKLSDTAKGRLGQNFVDAMEGGGVQNLTGMLQAMDVPNPPAMAWTLALTEFAGGLGLILGWKTRPLALALAFSQLVAINKVHANQGLIGGYEFNATLIAATGTLALAGPGKIALD